MTDNTIVNPVTRRRFFMFLGAAAASPIIHHIIPEKLIFDMSGPVTIPEDYIPWRHYFQSVSIPIGDVTETHILDLLNKSTVRYIIPALDKIFEPSPMFWSTLSDPLHWDDKVIKVTPND